MKVTVGTARDLTTRLFTQVGVRPDRATATARALALAEAWGLASHGLLRLQAIRSVRRPPNLTMWTPC